MIYLLKTFNMYLDKYYLIEYLSQNYLNKEILEDKINIYIKHRI